LASKLKMNCVETTLFAFVVALFSPHVLFSSSFVLSREQKRLEKGKAGRKFI